MLSQVLRLLDQLGRQSLGDDLDSQQKAQRARSLGRSPKAVSAPFMKNAKAAGPMRPVVVTTKGTVEPMLSFCSCPATPPIRPGACDRREWRSRIQQWPIGHLLGVRRQQARSGSALLGDCTHRGTETSQATSQPAAGWAGGSRMRLCSHTTSKPTATGPGVLCERSHGTASKAERTRALPASCLSWPPTQAGGLELGTL